MELNDFGCVSFISAAATCFSGMWRPELGLLAKQWLENFEEIQTATWSFAHYTNLESAEDTTTVSTVVLVLMELAMHLEEKGQKPGLAAISNCLLQDLTKRFKKVKDVQTVDFDQVHVAATFLDPRYKLLLTPEQIQEAKNLILSEASKSCDLPSEPGQIEEQPVEDKEPP